jgi:chromosome segregation ATPase
MKLQAANAEVSKVTSKLQMLNRETDENKYSQSSQFKAMTEEKERLEGQVESMRLSLQAVEDELSVTVTRLQSQVQRAESSLEETMNEKNSLLAEVAVLKQQLQEVRTHCSSASRALLTIALTCSDRVKRRRKTT